jgi:hypothetical protein
MEWSWMGMDGVQGSLQIRESLNVLYQCQYQDIPKCGARPTVGCMETLIADWAYPWLRLSVHSRPYNSKENILEDIVEHLELG